jgi:hypothetical protein
VLAEPPLCTRAELSDGTYSIDDLADFHEALDLKEELAEVVRANAGKK